MGRKRRFKVPRYVPKARGTCPVCGKPVFQGKTRWNKKYYHVQCLIKAVKEGRI